MIIQASGLYHLDRFKFCEPSAKVCSRNQRIKPRGSLFQGSISSCLIKLPTKWALVVYSLHGQLRRLIGLALR